MSIIKPVPRYGVPRVDFAESKSSVLSCSLGSLSGQIAFLSVDSAFDPARSRRFVICAKMLKQGKCNRSHCQDQHTQLRRISNGLKNWLFANSYCFKGSNCSQPGCTRPHLDFTQELEILRDQFKMHLSAEDHNAEPRDNNASDADLGSMHTEWSG
jgi:hypothetical protein